MLPFELCLLPHRIVVALQDLPWVPAVESELEIPVEHLELFLYDFVPLAK